MAAEVDLGHGEVTLSDVGVELVGAEDGEDGSKVLFMFFDNLGVDQQVVEVNDDGGVEVLAEDLVHEALEGGWGIGETKRDDGELVVAVTGTKGGLGDVGLGHADLDSSLGGGRSWRRWWPHAACRACCRHGGGGMSS